MAQPFTYGLDNPETLKKWNGSEYVVTPEQKRPGKKPARPDEVLLKGSNFNNIKDRANAF